MLYICKCCVEATNKKLLENHHSASLPPQSLVVFAFKLLVILKPLKKYEYKNNLLFR